QGAGPTCEVERGRHGGARTKGPKSVARALDQNFRGVACSSECCFRQAVKPRSLISVEGVFDGVAYDRVAEREPSGTEFRDEAGAERRQEGVDDSRRKRIRHARHGRGQELPPEHGPIRERFARRLGQSAKPVEDDLSHGRWERTERALDSASGAKGASAF